MRSGPIITLALAVAGCSGVQSDPNAPQLTIDCGSHLPGACEGKLGVGGVVWASGEVVSRDEGVVHAEHSDLHALIGVAPGAAEVDLVDRTTIVDSVQLEVASLTMLRLSPMPTTGVDGPLVDSTYDAAYRVPAATTLGVMFHPEVDGAPSIGTHYYKAILDGEPVDCFDHYCTGPVYYEGVPVHLDAGDHVLELQSVDGGRNFTFRLAAR